MVVGGASAMETQTMITLGDTRYDLIISNPPMGRRVARDGSLAELLESSTASVNSALQRARATLAASHGGADPER